MPVAVNVQPVAGVEILSPKKLATPCTAFTVVRLVESSDGLHEPGVTVTVTAADDEVTSAPFCSTFTVGTGRSRFCDSVFDGEVAKRSLVPDVKVTIARLAPDDEPELTFAVTVTGPGTLEVSSVVATPIALLLTCVAVSVAPGEALNTTSVSCGGETAAVMVTDSELTSATALSAATDTETGPQPTSIKNTRGSARMRAPLPAPRRSERRLNNHPMNVTLDQARALDAFARAAKAPTRTLLSVDSLDGVASRFEAEDAQLMVTVLPVDASPSLEVHRLPKLRARLVAHKSHPLSRLKKVTRKALAEHVLLTVRGSDPRLHLATAELDTQSMVHLLDFHAKKDAIVAGLGFGWLPDWLIERELQRGKLSPQAPAGQRSRLRARGRRAGPPTLATRPGCCSNASLLATENVPPLH